MTIKKIRVSATKKIVQLFDFYYKFFLNTVWQEQILKYRFMSLCGTALIGVELAIAFYSFAYSFKVENSYLIISNITLLVLALPVLVLLWYYRHHDVQNQIAKVQSSININLLNNGINLLLSRGVDGDIDIDKRSAGLILLAQLRQQDKSLQPQINAITQDIDLVGAKLQNADLRDIHLSGSNLTSADLQYTNLEQADVHSATLLKANLSGANFKKTNLMDTNLLAANLKDTKLQHADLQNANLEDADLQNANLEGVRLMNANLLNTNLKDTKLQNADLYGANLAGANLFGSNLQGANLQNANIENADLQNANLEGANLLGVKYNRSTKFPKGFNIKSIE